MSSHEVHDLIPTFTGGGSVETVKTKDLPPQSYIDIKMTSDFYNKWVKPFAGNIVSQAMIRQGIKNRCGHVIPDPKPLIIALKKGESLPCPCVNANCWLVRIEFEPDLKPSEPDLTLAKRIPRGKMMVKRRADHKETL